jgi:hypothetical protein
MQTTKTPEPRTIARDLIMAVVLFGIGLLVVSNAKADPMNIISTGIEGSDGNQYAYIGAPYETTGISFTNSGGTDTFNIITAFNGSDSVNGYNIGFAALVLGNGYGISLGTEGANGGLTAGVYQNSTYAMSQQIWGNRSGVIYGADWLQGSAANLAPTVLTGGNFLEGATISETLMGNGFYDLSITFANTAGLMGAIDSGVFWGTGDCANGAIYAQVPEPAAVAVFGAGLLAFGFMVRKRNQGGFLYAAT